MKLLITKYDEAVARHRSVLCLGLDPDPASHPSTDEKLRFCLQMVDAVSKHVSAVKVNENFVRDFSITEHRKLTEAIHSHGLITIYDCKMNDIENTVRAGITQVSKMGYDFITFNPVMGTLASAVKHGEANNVGIIVLLHPSNPEAEKYFRAETREGKKLYEKILEETIATDAEGVVVGLHPRITGEEIRRIRQTLGDERIILFPGVGAQGGDLETAVLNGGRRILVNVGRTIIYSPGPEQTASEINSRINELKHVHTGKNI